MLGAIIGDIVGSRWEFDPTNNYNFEWLSDENGFTDDTICTVAVADALLNERDFGESIHEWCNRYPHPMGGYGGRDAAAATALPSHNHEEGIKGAQTVAMAIFKALNYHRYQEAPKHIDEILDDCVKFSGYDINMPKASVLNQFDETCQGTVPVALKIITMSTCFEDAVRMAVSLGADADTLGAIVGSIAEAIWGIPLKLRHQIERYLPDDMSHVLSRFYHARPRSFQPLIDTCFAGDDFNDVSWDMLYDTDGKEVYDVKKKVTDEHEQKRRMMAERAKARENW